MGSFKFLDHMSDVYIEVRGDSMAELFEEAGKAIFETMTDLKRVKQVQKYEINLESEDEKSLLFDWIGELIFIFDTKNLVFSKINVLELKSVKNKYRLKAKLFGEEFDAKKHEIRVEIKAPTYSLMEIDTDSKPKIARFVIDI
ncbi:MAG: archease [Candidatus Helarchaeota archaeon]